MDRIIFAILSLVLFINMALVFPGRSESFTTHLGETVHYEEKDMEETVYFGGTRACEEVENTYSMIISSNAELITSLSSYLYQNISLNGFDLPPTFSAVTEGTCVHYESSVDIAAIRSAEHLFEESIQAGIYSYFPYAICSTERITFRKRYLIQYGDSTWYLADAVTTYTKSPIKQDRYFSPEPILIHSEGYLYFWIEKCY